MSDEILMMLGKMAGVKHEHANDSEYVGDLDWRELARLVACECIYTIRMHMPRNGVNSPENMISKRHIEEICKKFDIEMPMEYMNSRPKDL